MLRSSIMPCIHAWGGDQGGGLKIGSALRWRRRRMGRWQFKACPVLTPSSWQIPKFSLQVLNLLQEMLGAVQVFHSQVVIAKGETLLVRNLSDAAVRALTTLKFSFLSFFKTIDLKVIGGAKPELLSDIIVPKDKVRHVTERSQDSLVKLRAIKRVVESW